MLRNLASSLFLTERDAEFEPNAPKVKGRVTTTLHKAKEVRPLVENDVKICTVASRVRDGELRQLAYDTVDYVERFYRAVRSSGPRDDLDEAVNRQQAFNKRSGVVLDLL